MIIKITSIIFFTLFILNINSVSAYYKYSINDKLNVDKTYTKIKKYINKTKKPDFTSLKIKNKIELILWKNEKEIYDIKKYNNYLEYALVNIYFNIKLDYLNKSEHFYNPHILENDYIKILVWDYKFIWESKTYNNSFSINNKNLTNLQWRKYIEFFKINQEQKTEDYIINTIKCDIKTNTQEYINFTENKAYYTEWCSYSNNWVSYFERISPTTLIYVNAGQDYVWIDFSSMEIKK